MGFTQGSDGTLTLIGQSGSVAGDVASVKVTNIRTSQTATGFVNSDGTYSISIPGAGSDEFSIVLTDLAGNVSAPIYMHGNDTALQVAIDSPSANTSIDGNSINAAGTFSGALNVGVTVNGVPALIYGNRWIANNVPLNLGVNSITVVITTGGGLSATQSVSVISTGTTPLILTANPAGSGVSPFEATFQYEFLGATTPQSLQIDYTGSGNYTTINDPSAVLSYTYDTPGVYPVTVILTDSNNAQYQAQYWVVVGDRAQMDILFKSVWGDMATALTNGDKAAAMNTLDNTAQQNYGPVFDTLLPQMKQITASFSPLMQSSVSSSNAEYIVVRKQDGQQNAYFVDFIKDMDGVWRIDSM